MAQNLLTNSTVERSGRKGCHHAPSPAEGQAKLNELRCTLGPLTGHALEFCSDSCLHRYLLANKWSVKKSWKMLRETIKWRGEYKPEEIKWQDVAKEAETGKIYRAKFCDKQGRPVLVMRPGTQNTSQLEGQIRYLVYCMESAILNLPSGQEQIVWLVDFKGWNLSMVPVKTARETTHILQDHYPETLAYALLCDPPKIFETFWKVMRPFLDPKTYRKVKFVYTEDAGSKKLIQELFEMEELELAFGGKSLSGLDNFEYSRLMQEDDIKRAVHWNLGDIKSLDLDIGSAKALDGHPGTNVEA